MKGFSESFVKPNPNVITPAQAESLRRKSLYLETNLKEELEKRQEAEKKLQAYRERSLRTEGEFSRIIMKNNSTIAQLNGKENYSQDIWNRLTVEIEKFNENSEKMLEKRCNEILEIMNRKVSQLLGKTEFEIKKNHKLSEEEYKSIKEEIKEALNITKEIEEENEVLKKTNRKLKFKVDILREEKQLLVEELNQKKLLLFRVKKDYIDPTCSQTSSIRPRSMTAKTFGADCTKASKYAGEPSLKLSSISIDNPEMRGPSTERPKSKDRETMMLKTDNHFKICLEREKRKNTQLKGLMGKMQAKNKEISVMIEREQKQKTREGVVTERENKLLRVIEDIKIRLILKAGSSREPGLSQREMSDLLKY